MATRRESNIANEKLDKLNPARSNLRKRPGEENGTRTRIKLIRNMMSHGALPSTVVVDHYPISEIQAVPQVGRRKADAYGVGRLAPSRTMLSAAKIAMLSKAIAA